MALFALFFLVSANAACTPLSVQNDFNLTEYVRATWYVQRQ